MSDLRELPGYRHAERPGRRPWEPGDAERYRARMAGAWHAPAGDARPMRYNVFFESDFETLAGVLSMLARRGVANVDVRSEPGSRSRAVGFDATFEEWQDVLLALDGFGIDEARRRTHQGEIGRGGG